MSRDRATIRTVAEGDLADLLALMRAYCEFYETDPSDAALLALSRTLIADPGREGLQLLARSGDGTAVGFATVFWTWDTTRALRVGVMNDLYVAPEARGAGLADALIAACVEVCEGAVAGELTWITAPGNERAQAVYDRVGGIREAWVNYSLPVSEAAPGARPQRRGASSGQ